MREELLMFPGLNSVPTGLPGPRQFSSSDPKAWWCRKSQAASAALI